MKNESDTIIDFIKTGKCLFKTREELEACGWYIEDFIYYHKDYSAENV